jgi:hypothetical protein
MISLEDLERRSLISLMPPIQQLQQALGHGTPAWLDTVHSDPSTLICDYFTTRSWVGIVGDQSIVCQFVFLNQEPGGMLLIL